MDYQELGFKCGIEAHQQLETHKLFCECPSLVNDPSKPELVVERQLRAVAGETGEVDIAAAHEMAKGKKFVYESCSTSSCLVELDEEPPHEINPEAVGIALQVAKLLNAKITDEIQVMRKTVVDGSNVSGFQRTALIGRDGYIKTSKGKVGITVVCLEEEAAKKVKDDNDSVRYRLDRLGVPLIEIGTDASIKDPEHAKEVAEKLGMILRSTGKVKRGIGTIRQDVNVSIKGGERTEIKGFQELKSIPKVVEGEVKRQLDDIKKGKKIEKTVRKANADGSSTFLRPMPGAARMYPETDVMPVSPEDIEEEEIEMIEDKAKRYEKELGLGGDLAVQMAKSDKAGWFESFAAKFKNVKPTFIAETLIASVKEIRRKFNVDVDGLTDKEFEEIFGYLDEGKISKDVVMDVLIDYSKGKFDLDKYAAVSEEDLEKEVKKIVDSNKGAPFGAIMGQVMGKMKGKADGKKISELVKKFVK